MMRSLRHAREDRERVEARFIALMDHALRSGEVLDDEERRLARKVAGEGSAALRSLTKAEVEAALGIVCSHWGLEAPDTDLLIDTLTRHA